MIEGIDIKKLPKYVDERGFFSELLREDWDIIQEEDIVQINFSFSHPGVIRAWHRHLRGQKDFFICIKGSIKVCGFDDRINSSTNQELDEILLSREDLKMVRMPGNVWHGFKVIGSEPAMLLYGVNRLYDSADPDEERRPWDDPTIIPSSINGNINDPRVGNKWDWNFQPHR